MAIDHRGKADRSKARYMSAHLSSQLQTVPPRGSVALALGGGAARGFAHIPILEGLDELGIKPRIIAGTSIGSLIGAVYANGMSGHDIRDYALELFGGRSELIRRLINGWPGSLTNLFNPMTPAIVNPKTLFEIVLPDDLAESFSDLKIPLKVVAADFHAAEQVIIEEGPLLPAISASSALPALLTPVEHQDRILIDGGFVNPTPFDILTDEAEFIVACDVTGKGPPRNGNMPNSMDAWIGAAQITLHSIVKEKLKYEAPDILIRPQVGRFRVLDFYKINEILAAAEPAKVDFVINLEKLLSKASKVSVI